MKRNAVEHAYRAKSILVNSLAFTFIFEVRYLPIVEQPVSHSFPRQLKWTLEIYQECIPVGCVPPAWCPHLPACIVLGGCTCQEDVPAQGGIPTWGCTCPRECTCQGSVSAQGVYLPGGVPAGGYLPGEKCTCWGVPAQGGTCPGDVPALGVVYLPGGCTCQGGTCQGTPSLWTEWQVQKYYLAPNFVCGR